MQNIKKKLAVNQYTTKTFLFYQGNSQPYKLCHSPKRSIKKDFTKS